MVSMLLYKMSYGRTRLVRAGAVKRQGKWAELYYRDEKYPPFPLGSFGHIVSRGLARAVVEHDGWVSGWVAGFSSIHFCALAF